MRNSPDHQYVYSAPVQPITLGEVAGLIAFCGLLLVVAWLDTSSIQVIGRLLYPLEYALNAVFFPNAVTPLRGNGTALLVLIPTVALGAVVFAFVRLALRAAAIVRRSRIR